MFLRYPFKICTGRGVLFSPSGVGPGTERYCTERHEVSYTEQYCLRDPPYKAFNRYYNGM
eukprot:802357-Rhodomonas_salina.2